MRFFAKKKMLFVIALSLAFMPLESIVTDASAEKKYKVTIRKVSQQSTESRQARIEALREQRARDLGEYYDGSSFPHLSSDKALVVNQNTGEVKYAKNSQVVSPIASITKLMTAMVVLDAGQPFDEMISITNQDIDTIKKSRSRLLVGTTLSRADLFELALMSSENRAAFALARNYPGGKKAFAKAMNAKALSLGLMDTHFTGPTGLMHQNTSTAEDLYKLVAAAYQYPEIRKATTTPSDYIRVAGRKNPVEFKNTNKLVGDGEWDIGLSKTGFINEAGRCLVMQATIAGEPMIVVLLDAAGVNKRTGDANRVRKWVEYNRASVAASAESAKDASQFDQHEAQPKLVMSERIWN